MGVCGFGSNEVLSGRPYGGCAIFWKQGLSNDITFVPIDCRRLCGICCSFGFGKILFLNGYLPYECDDASRIEFRNELGIIEDVLESHNGYHVILGGDFNVDIGRACTNTSVLQDFCAALNLYIDANHDSYSIDYTYHFAMKTFHALDHFVISQELFAESVGNIFALHEVDNTSDHEPICMIIEVDHLVDNAKPRSFESKIAWHKASSENLAAYANALKHELANLFISLIRLLFVTTYVAKMLVTPLL